MGQAWGGARISPVGPRRPGSREEVWCFDPRRTFPRIANAGFVALRSDDHDFVDAVVVLTGEEFIDGTMEGLPTQGAGTRLRCPIRLRKAVMEGRTYRQLQAADFGPGKAAQPQ